MRGVKGPNGARRSGFREVNEYVNQQRGPDRAADFPVYAVGAFVRKVKEATNASRSSPFSKERCCGKVRGTCAVYSSGGLGRRRAFRRIDTLSSTCGGNVAVYASGKQGC